MLDPKSSAERFVLPLTGTVALVIGVILRGPPADPDVEFTGAQMLGVLFTFLSFFLGVVGWGTFLTGKLKFSKFGEWAMALSLGTTLSSVVAMALGHLGFISYDFGPLAIAWISAGWLVGSNRLRALFPLPGRISWAWIPGLLLSILILSWMARASVTHLTTDPFFYHLLGPRHWADAGRIAFWPNYPASIHAVYWEYLFIWGNLLLGAPAGKGLIEGQIFGQYAHVGLGVTMTAAALFSWATQLTSWRTWALFAVLVGLLSRTMYGVAWLAKNDFGCGGWALVSILLLFAVSGSETRRERLGRLGVAGVFAGIAVISKPTLSMTVGPILLVWAMIAFAGGIRFGRVKDACLLIFWVAGWVMVAMLPILIRNYVFTGDPVYPFLMARHGQVTPWLGPTRAMAFINLFSGAEDIFQAFWSKFWGFINDVPGITLIGFLLPAAAFFRPRLSTAVPVIGAILLGYVGYAWFHFIESYPRWMAPFLLLMPVLGVATLSELVEWGGSRLGWKGVRTGLRGVLGAYCIFIAGQGMRNAPDWWRTAMSGRSPTFVIRDDHLQSGGMAMAWLRLNAGEGGWSATTGYQMLYYVSHLRVVAIANQVEFDEAVGELHDLGLIVERLRSFGVKYLVDIAKWSSRYYWPISWFTDDIGYRYPEAVVWEGPGSFILDLERVEEEMARSCTVRRPPREFDW